MEKERIAESAFGALLRRHRLTAGLSQEMLAERARMSADSISALECGQRRYPYAETVLLLAKALALAPAEIRELEAAAVRPRGPHERTAARKATGHRRSASTNLPLQRTRLVGRDAEIVDVVTFFHDRRLVTVTGAGGVGKTRTALAAGEALLEDTINGVWLVELAPVTGAFVASAVAQVLGVQESADRSVLAAIIADLEQKAPVLILDNCEHVIADVAQIADALLGHCRELRILATSREPLRIAGEQLYRLPSLRVPASGDVSRLTAEAAANHAAVELFIERAKAIDREFTLTDDSAPVVAEICRRLDGLPLAIELAAARVNVLSVRQLRERLEARFRVLSGLSRDALPRQQTIRALIDWSHDLLDERERTLFRRLAIFVNGFTFEGAVAVASDAQLDEVALFDVLASLVDKSLMTVDLRSERSRYRLLESTREYALDKLIESGERVTLERRHAEWLATFVEDAAQTVWRMPLARWLPQIEGEFDNLRAALRWALEERGDASIGQRIAGAVPSLWHSCGLGREGRRWIEAALQTLDASSDPRIAGRLWLAQANLANGEARVFAALRAIRCIESWRDDLRLAQAYVYLAGGYLDIQSLAPSLDASERALNILKRQGLTEVALLATALVVRGQVFKEIENYSEARVAYSEARELYQKLGDERRRVWIEIVLAELEFAVGDVRAAVALAQSAAARAREAADVGMEAQTRVNAAAYRLVLGDLAQARDEARAALELARFAQRDLYGSIAVQHLATIAALEGDIRRAAVLRGYVDAWYGARGSARERTEQVTYDILMRELRARASDEQLEELGAAGARLSDIDATTEAFGAGGEL